MLRGWYQVANDRDGLAKAYQKLSECVRGDASSERFTHHNALIGGANS